MKALSLLKIQSLTKYIFLFSIFSTLSGCYVFKTDLSYVRRYPGNNVVAPDKRAMKENAKEHKKHQKVIHKKREELATYEPGYTINEKKQKKKKRNRK